MKQNSLHHRRWVWLALLTLLGMPGAAADEPDAWTVRLETGSHRLLPQPRPLARIAIGDPQVADVELLSAREVLLYAKKVGVTELKLWPKDGAQASYRIVVDTPSAAAREAIAVADEAGLQLRSAGPLLRLEGESQSLPGQVEARRALRTGSPPAEFVDAARQGFDQQVQAEIKVVEVSRRALMQSGVTLGKNTMDTTLSITPPGALSGVQGGGSEPFTLESSSGFLPIAQAFNLVAGNAGKGLLGIMSLLEANGFAYTLAEPSLTVMNGQSASFLAGGEVPIPVSQGTSGAISIQYREYGVRLQLTPTILDRERIVLKVAPEVSELDATTAVQSGGVSVPGFTVRRTETTVQLADGESFVISGLISRNTASAVDKVPFLGDIPILGAFFKSTRFDRSDKELIMIVTPRLVRALAAGTATPPLPGAREGAYQPGFAELMFLESGRYTAIRSGFSD